MKSIAHLGLKRSILFTFASLTIVSCSNQSENSLGVDGDNLSACPSGGCADMTAKPTDTKITFKTLSKGVVGQRLEIQADECATSTYTENFVSLQFKKDGVVMNPGLPVLPVTADANGQLVCKNGKLHFVIDTGSAAAGSYIVTMQLNVKSGTTFIAPTTAKTSVTFSKY